MRKFILVFLLGCHYQTAELIQEESQPSDNLEEQEIEKQGQEDWDPCNITQVEKFIGPDGKVYFIEVPILCQAEEIDRGDPEYLEQLEYDVLY